jgi:hypothetical protein
MLRRRQAIFSDRNAAGFRNFRRYFRARQHAAVAGLGALRELDLDHLDLRLARLQRELLRVEISIRRAAAEIAAADLPDQIAAVLAVMAADRAFPGVVSEIAELGALVERAHRVCGQRAEAHRRNIEYRTGVRLLAAFTANLHAEIKIIDRYRTQRVIDPFVAGQVHAFAGSERLSALDVLGALINE